MRALIVDDEPLARQRIEDLLAKESDVELAGFAADGAAAVEAIRTLQPDLLFLDIQMPGMTGIEVVDAVGIEQMPVTIFTTAYDQYAVKAFELAALDYLMKPFDDERFAQALDRARESIRAAGGSRAPKYLERIGVEARGQVRFVAVDRIEYITADGPYAELHVAGRTLALRERMHTLEERLDPDVFFRIHRSAIVRLDRVDALLRRPGGDYAVRLTDGTELSLSRAKREELERRLGGAAH
ncbi:MAG TPA: LytTR family DNA-binding domain-containing protein [Thermoanaerobaculia bacterium]|jgi:two-component system LytT family response regulator